MQKEAGKLSFKNKLAYGTGEIYGGGVGIIIATLYLFFLTDVVGMNAALAGVIVFASKAWDAVSDPLMGILSDKTKSSLGRRRFYLLIGVFPVFLSFLLMWQTFPLINAPGREVLQFFYYFFAYIFYSTAFTIVTVPYASLLVDMTKDYRERASISGFRMTFGAISAVICGVVPPALINAYGGPKTAEGYAVMATVFSLFFALPWLLVFFGVKEERVELQASSFNLLKQYKRVMRNKSFRQHAAIFVSTQTAVDFVATLFIYFITIYLNREKDFMIVMGILMLMNIFFMQLHTAMAKKYTKTTPLLYGSAFWAAGLLFTLLLAPGQPFWFLYLIPLMVSVGASASIYVCWAILPEVADVDELIYATKSSGGLYSGFATFIRKLSGGLAGIIIGLLLSAFGYNQALAEQGAVTINAIRAMFGLMPPLFIAVGWYFARKYRLDKENHALVLSEIERRRLGGLAVDVDPKTKAVCEEVSGLPYEQLWTDPIEAGIISKAPHSVNG